MNFFRSLIKLPNDEVADLPASAEYQYSRLLQCCHAAHPPLFLSLKSTPRSARTDHHPRYTPMMVCPALSQLHKHFANAFTGKEPEEGSGGPFNSNFYCLSVRNVVIANPSIHLLDEFRSAT
jgi:hypothetical protein